MTCQHCGAAHDDLPLSFHAEAPEILSTIPEEELEARVDLDGELCVVDDEYFFIHGIVRIPIIGSDEHFEWGVWCSLSEASFDRCCAEWEKAGREASPPYFGWLSTLLPGYDPPTINLKTRVHTRPVGERPLVELEPTEHPLAVQQRQGISLAQAREIAASLLHAHD